jgi:hypothetical protein
MTKSNNKKMELEISEVVISGLKVFYNEIPPELSKKLLANVWQHLFLTGETSMMFPVPKH